MADAAPAQKSGSGSRALLWLVILLLLGTVWWLASERNARKYTLSSRDGILLISQGRFFPTGTALITPEDPPGKLYAGIALPAGSKGVGEIEYDDENALDRGLYDLLSSTAHTLAKKGDAASYALADGLAKRLSGLRGLTAEELADLTALRAELAFWSANGDVQAAVALLANATRKLEEVRANGGEHATQARPLQDSIAPIATELAQLGVKFAPPAPAATPASPGDAVKGSDLLDGGAPDPAVPAPSVASPPQAPPTNSIIESTPPAHGASAPGSVRSGASRGQ